MKTSILLWSLVSLVSSGCLVFRNPKLEYTRKEIIEVLLETEQTACSCNVFLKDSTQIKYLSWFEDPDEITEGIGYTLFDELNKSFRMNNRESIRIDSISSRFSNGHGQNNMTMGLSNYGVSNDGNFILIYVERIYGPLDASGYLYIYEVKRIHNKITLIEKHSYNQWSS